MTMTTSVSQFLSRPGGRQVEVHDLTPDAPADAPVVLLCHVAPGSGAFDPDPAVTAARGIRLIAVDRAGYGGSDAADDNEFATVVLAADDAAAALETVLMPGTKAGVVGWSAGGRVALALAQRRPDLVGRVAVVATPAPDEEVPWIPEDNKAGIEALRGAAASVAHAALTQAFGPLLDTLTGEARFGLMGVGEADAGLLGEPGVADRLRVMLDEAFAKGAAGIAADIAGYTLRPWGFEPGEVGTEVLLGYGAADEIGPAHGEWWQRALPHARLEVVPEVGHLVVVPLWDRVLSHVSSTDV
ncbi:alpha/beta hydrolase [Pseudonocardia aurantiaca]|uniref:Alpha/beta fold hydrolase n=1 Tax=Pseudonocardia aurantiaca TaxID=75290 RepID=A0ABW4FY15_9PSEU